MKGDNVGLLNKITSIFKGSSVEVDYHVQKISHHNLPKMKEVFDVINNSFNNSREDFIRNASPEFIDSIAENLDTGLAEQFTKAQAELLAGNRVDTQSISRNIGNLRIQHNNLLEKLETTQNQLSDLQNDIDGIVANDNVVKKVQASLDNAKDTAKESVSKISESGLFTKKNAAIGAAIAGTAIVAGVLIKNHLSQKKDSVKQDGNQPLQTAGRFTENELQRRNAVTSNALSIA